MSCATHAASSGSPASGPANCPGAKAAFARNAEHVASHRCQVIEHRWVNNRYKYLQLKAPTDLALVTRPGQFYQLKCPVTQDLQPFLLRPMSVYGMGPQPDVLEFLYSVAGVGTHALSSLDAGDHMDIVGPLGNTFTLLPEFKHILVVARGVGLATMAPLLQQAARAGIHITALMSARTQQDLMRDEFLRGATADVHTVYDSDGSSSVEAVQALVRQLLDAQHHDAVYTCGSHRLLMLLQQILADYPQTLGQVAMEQRMACAMGVCLSCVRLFDIDGDKQFYRVCREGPVFSIRDVVGEVEFG